MKIFLIGNLATLHKKYILPLKSKTDKFYKIQTSQQLLDKLDNNCIPDFTLIYCDCIAFSEQELFSGADCALLIKEKVPHCKLILITENTEALLHYSLYRNITLGVLVTANDFSNRATSDNKRRFIHTLFSASVQQSMNKIKSYPILMSFANIRILICLVYGLKVRQISTQISLSESAVQKRICKMLKEFNVPDSRELIQFIKKNQLF